MATGTTAQQIVEGVTPAAGEAVTEGTILEWHVKVGDFIKADDTIVEISTDKVDVELPSPASGTVTEILIEEGDTVTVGQVIARIAAQSAPPPVGTRGASGPATGADSAGGAGSRSSSGAHSPSAAHGASSARSSAGLRSPSAAHGPSCSGIDRGRRTTPRRPRGHGRRTG